MCWREKMSKRLKDNIHFFQLLLSSSKAQARQLLKTVTPEQSLLIAEIAYNLLHTIDDKDIQENIKNKKKLLQDLIRLNTLKRVATIKRNNLKVLRLILLIKNKLLYLLK